MPPRHGPVSRRALLAAAAALGLARPAGAADDHFAALRRPARPMREPGRAVLLAAALAGQRVVAVGERGVVALSDDGARHWRQAPGVPTSVTLTALRFANERTGWAVGHGGVILRTDDAGERWALQADGALLAGVARDWLARRADAGGADALAAQVAHLLADGPDKPLLDLLVMDPLRVMVVGSYNLCFETTDGGQRWTCALDRIANPKAQHLYAVAAHGGDWLVAGEQGLLGRSTDGGRHFERIASPYEGTWFTLCAPAPGEWLLAGLRGHAFRSTDRGSRWVRLEGAGPSSVVGATVLPGGGAVLANQAGQLFLSRGGAALRLLNEVNLPPLAQVLALPGGGLLTLGVAGASLMPGLAS